MNKQELEALSRKAAKGLKTKADVVKFYWSKIKPPFLIVAFFAQELYKQARHVIVCSYKNKCNDLHNALWCHD